MSHRPPPCILATIRTVDEQELEQFLAKITHEWNNALMAIAPWADVLKRKYPADPTLQKAATAISEGIAAAKRTTDELREFRKTLRP